MEIQKLDAKGLELLAQEEGIRLKPYLDSAKIPTIGVGCTYYENGVRVKLSDPSITKERAIELFSNLLPTYEKAVWSVTVDTITQNQFNALVSLTYNIGVSAFKNSSLLKLVNNNYMNPKIVESFKAWRNSAGKPVLLGRRIREGILYFS